MQTATALENSSPAEFSSPDWEASLLFPYSSPVQSGETGSLVDLLAELGKCAPKHSPGTWRAIKWTSHAAVTVTVDDDQSITGKRVIAECDTEEDARLIASAPDLLFALKKILERSGSEFWPVVQEMARQAIERAEQQVANDQS